MNSINNTSFVRGEVVDVVIPDEQHEVKKIQRQRNVLKNQHIARVLIVSGNDDGNYDVLCCADTPKKCGVRFQAGSINGYIRAVPKLKIDGAVLRRIPNAVLENKEDVFQAILETQIERKERKDARKEQRKSDRTNQTAAGSNTGIKLVKIVDKLTSAKIRYKKDTVVCPKCKKLLPTGERIVYVNGHGFPTLRVGICEKCNCYYTFSDKVFQNPGELYGWPVLWSNLRYDTGQGDKVVFKEIHRRERSIAAPSINTAVRDQVVPKTNKITDSTSKSIPLFEGMIKQLPVIGVHNRNCPICRRSPDGTRRVKYQIFGEGKTHERYAHSRYCSSCDIIFFDAEQEKEVRRRASDSKVYSLDAGKFKTATELMNAAKSEPIAAKLVQQNIRFPHEFDAKVIPNLTREHKEILVYAKKCHCTSCMSRYGVETIRNRTAVIDTEQGKQIEVNTMFCIGCGKYFMNYTSFEQYRRTYGGIMLEFRFTGELLNKQSSYSTFASDSVLSRCGYSVKAGVSREYRQGVLRYILESRKATKREIVELISGFIDLKYNMPNYEGACARWQEDIYFVNQYQIESQKKVYGLKFKQGK